jgi:hypothetical protein
MAHQDVHDRLFVNLAVTIGPGFYGGMKHDTNEEIAAVLASHAARFDGVLREVFLILENYYRTHIGMPLHPLVEAPDPNIVDSTGGLNNFTDVSFGNCGLCTPEAGGVGCWRYVNGEKQACVSCS